MIYQCASHQNPHVRLHLLLLHLQCIPPEMSINTSQHVSNLHLIRRFLRRSLLIPMMVMMFAPEFSSPLGTFQHRIWIYMRTKSHIRKHPRKVSFHHEQQRNITPISSIMCGFPKFPFHSGIILHHQFHFVYL